MTTATTNQRTIRDATVRHLAETWGIAADRRGRKIVVAGARAVEFAVAFDYWAATVDGVRVALPHPPSARMDCPETLAAVFATFLAKIG